ncbi:leucine-rich repeat-containing protein 42 isoform X2 [Oryzias melastigma]|uniref:leucine-rich repeat-containing protein 42 isoform X2 n=1 Tax=Oryzias melastigma TaxID=30732 RepID=UPI000CF7C3EB|nr:leucine-rich repeat-containing protein 42 isoform X2 [Oryzias melastigma]
MMEGSSVYVRERGKLWRVCDLAVAPAAPPAGTRAESRAPTDNHCRMSSRAEGSLHTSLFQITLSFVVDHIHLVESLVGFPEQIGREVFAAAAAGHVFSRPNSAKALRLFADAYGDLLLGSLCLRHRFPLLHERMEEIRAFRCLKSLDLFGCRLGDHHEIFQHVTSLPNSLVQLSVGGNGLSDSGLQRLTAPVRMRRSGLDGLRVLDVSYNPVSEKALRYLTCLTKLSQLDVSQTEMRISAGLQRTMWAVLGLLHSHTPLDLFNHSGCRTGGWAEQVVDQWEAIGSETPPQKTVEESRRSALCFYGRQRWIREGRSSCGPVDGGVEEDPSRAELHFYRPSTGGAEEPPSVAVSPPEEAPRRHQQKRKQHPGERGVSQSPPRKRSFPSALTAEDMELLRSY